MDFREDLAKSSLTVQLKFFAWLIVEGEEWITDAFQVNSLVPALKLIEVKKIVLVVTLLTWEVLEWNSSSWGSCLAGLPCLSVAGNSSRKILP